jgi:hypothetical protein
MVHNYKGAPKDGSSLLMESIAATVENKLFNMVRNVIIVLSTFT